MKIAIIAHDGMKAQMVSFLMHNRKLIKSSGVEIVATGTTGKFVKEAGLDVQCVKSGPLGGDAQIASMMVEGKIDMIFFFRDPLGKHPHEPDVQMLLRLCDVHNVPLATNPATAERLIKSLEEI
jgi:methylglyoxal synthase